MYEVLASVDLHGRRDAASDGVTTGVQLETELAIGASRRRGRMAGCDDGYDDAPAGCSVEGLLSGSRVEWSAVLQGTT